MNGAQRAAFNNLMRSADGMAQAYLNMSRIPFPPKFDEWSEFRRQFADVHCEWNEFRNLYFELEAEAAKSKLTARDIARKSSVRHSNGVSQKGG